MLLDENLDWRLERELAGHTVKSVSEVGWSGMKNGTLLAKAEIAFDVFLTMDGSIPHQQNMAKYRIAVVALKARSNRLADTKPLMDKVRVLLPHSQPGTVTIIS